MTEPRGTYAKRAADAFVRALAACAAETTTEQDRDAALKEMADRVFVSRAAMVSWCLACAGVVMGTWDCTESADFASVEFSDYDTDEPLSADQVEPDVRFVGQLLAAVAGDDRPTAVALTNAALTSPWAGEAMQHLWRTAVAAARAVALQARGMP